LLRLASAHHKPRPRQPEGIARQLASRGRRSIIGATPTAETGDGILDSTMTVIVLMLILIVYFLPTLIAYSREQLHRGAVVIFNIFLGWTLIGWLVVFLWAALGRVEEPQLA
jgi:hypothetical protein